MRFLFQMRPLEDGIFLDVGAGGHAEHFIVVTGADAASGTLPREVVLVDDLPGGDVAVGDEGAAGVLAGGLLGGQRFDAHFPDHGQRPLEILAEQLEILVIHSVVIGLAVLYFLGKKAQKKQEAQQEQIEAAKQTIPMLIIDKKRLPIKESGLPQMVIDQTPKLMRRSKLPIVKAKVGPRIMTLVADEQVFDLIPVKKEVKADVSGIYITGVKGVRGSLETPPKKQGFFKRMRAKANQMTKDNSKK